MERWDIYDKNKVRTGRTMERNHFNLADDEYHLTVLGVIRRPDGRFLITKRVMTKAWAPGWWEVSGGAAQAGEESEEARIFKSLRMCFTGCMNASLLTCHIPDTDQKFPQRLLGERRELPSRRKLPAT